jgi:hypothetical protein
MAGRLEAAGRNCEKNEQADSLLAKRANSPFKASNVPRTPTWASLQSPYRQSVPGERVSVGTGLGNRGRQVSGYS